MKCLLALLLIALMALGTSCAQISQPVVELAPQGTSDGIKVHGDWTVTVTNPDGTVEAVHEFENAIYMQAQELFAKMLTGEKRVSMGEGNTQGWRIIIKSDAGASLVSELHCMEDNTLQGFSSQSTTNSWSNWLPALAEYDSDNNLHVTASCLVEEVVGDQHMISGVTTVVWTKAIMEDGTDEPENAIGLNYFSYKTLSPSIEIKNHLQTISFNVNISFE